MPTPNPNESKNDFMKRCVPMVMDEGKDNDQAVAICLTMFDKKDMQAIEYDTLTGIEIAYPGTFNAMTGTLTLTENDIEEMITNFENKLASPYLNINHEDKFTDKVKDSLKVLRLGTVSKLYRKGKKLVCDFINVPKKISELIKKGLLGQVSIEFYKKLKRADKEYQNVLTAVSFFGRELPAIPGLENNIPTLFESLEDGEVVKICCKEETLVDNVTISQSEYDRLKSSVDELIKFKAAKENENLVKLQNENKFFQDENKNLKEEVSKLTTEKEDLVKFKAEALENEKKHLEKEATEFVEKFADRIQPAYVKDYVGDYIRFANEDPQRLDRFKKEIEGREVALFQNTQYPEDGFREGKVNLRDEDSVDRAIKARMKNKGETWEEAREVILKTAEEVV